MRIKLAQTKPDHEVAYQELCALVNRHSQSVTAIELLAIASNMVGKLIALQDQRVISSDMAMEIVVKNIEHGNQEVLQSLMNNTAGSA